MKRIAGAAALALTIGAAPIWSRPIVIGFPFEYEKGKLLPYKVSVGLADKTKSALRVSTIVTGTSMGAPVLQTCKV